MTRPWSGLLEWLTGRLSNPSRSSHPLALHQYLQFHLKCNTHEKSHSDNSIIVFGAQCSIRVYHYCLYPFQGLLLQRSDYCHCGSDMPSQHGQTQGRIRHFTELPVLFSGIGAVHLGLLFSRYSNRQWLPCCRPYPAGI